ncbi:YfjI family protein [Stenotrophomonas sp. B1-1]|uniref:YfjI family protein n=1 Tax=Stenotrophomonas sp. B1-1 TaxID=2710648 RepID=UPI0013DD454F|nr:YfjI family protein [Stenotrophomonas sp. B1-1]
MITSFGRIAPLYPMNAFLAVARNAGMEVSRNVQAPDALIGMSLIHAISMACQGLIDVKLPTGQVRPVSQNLLIIAESGERKSTVSSLLFAPFREADTEAVASHKEKKDAHQAELGAWEAKNKGLRSAIARVISRGQGSDELEARLLEHGRCKPIEPRLRYFMRQEITGKAITEALVGDGESIAISTDEGHVLFRSEAMSHLGLLNRLWDSPGVLMRDRAEENLLALNPRVSVSIMTQHEPFKAFLDRKGSVAKGSGHWARYLVGWPQSNMGFRMVSGVEPIWDHLPVFQERIRVLLHRYRTQIELGPIGREVIEFSYDAKSRWIELAQETERLLRQGEYLSDINDFAAKVMEILARLAAAMHYFAAEAGPITVDTLNRAFEIVKWHESEYKNLFSPENAAPQDLMDARAVAYYLKTRIWRGASSDTWVPRNEVLRNGPVRKRDRLTAALDLLQMRGAVTIGTGSRDRKCYLQLMNHFFNQHQMSL